jgi:HEAT repeat protein
VMAALALEGDTALIPALTAVAELDPDQKLRSCAVMGLARMADRAAIPGLLAGLRAPDRSTRIWAIKGLEKLRARDAVPELASIRQ